MVPFVVHLVPEYVVPILLVIRDGLVDVATPGTAQHEAYRRFVAANPALLQPTRKPVAG
jgi:hypothetical protein